MEEAGHERLSQLRGRICGSCNSRKAVLKRPKSLEQKMNIDGSSNANSSRSYADGNAPLWKYVIRIDGTGKPGKNDSFVCNFCHQTYEGSYNRVIAHLLGGYGIVLCSYVPEECFWEMHVLVEESKNRVRRSLPTQVPLPSGGSDTNSSSSESVSHHGPCSPFTNAKKRKDDSGSIHKVFQTEQKEKNYTERSFGPIQMSWQDKGVSIFIDGLSDSRKSPLINITAFSEGGAMLLKAVNHEGEVKDGSFIANLLINTIEEIGPENVVQVVTDNVEVFKAAGFIVEAKFHHIFWTPCAAHALDLALKSIYEPSTHPMTEQRGWIAKTCNDSRFIKNFIMNHSMRSAMFNKHRHLKLLSNHYTRFASTFEMLRIFKRVEDDLNDLVLSEEWDLYKKDDVEKSSVVEKKISDDCFWGDIDYILRFTTPIYEMLRMADPSTPCLHLVYEWWDSMIEKVRDVIYKNEGRQANE